MTDIECGSTVGNLETADNFDNFDDFDHHCRTCRQLVLAEQAELDYWILNESATTAEIGMFETELEDKFLPDPSGDERDPIPSIFEVDPYSAVGRTGQAQLRGEDPEQLIRYHPEAPLVRLGTICQWCTGGNCRHNILMEFDRRPLTIHEAQLGDIGYRMFKQPLPLLAEQHLSDLVTDFLLTLDFTIDYDDDTLIQYISPYRKRKTPRYAQVAAAYKTKDKKIQPVDEADGIGKPPGGRRDWYERAKLRETPQEQFGKYRQHIIPRFCDIPRRSRLTPTRMKELDVGDSLWPAEREFLEEVLIAREKVFAFEWQECGTLHEDVSPPIVLNTIEHKAWQAANFPCPRALLPIVIKMLKDRLDRGALEFSEGPYRNPWFLVKKKKPGEYRLINSATHLNAVTRRDANLPPSVDEFAEEFAGCQIASLVDLYSGYDQMVLHPKSRDLTAFFTPIGLVRNTRIPQGATNSVAQFCRVMNLIMEGICPSIAMPFMDDIGVKGPYSDYDGEETLLGMRRFMFEHIQNIDKTLERIERACGSIGAKS